MKLLGLKFQQNRTINEEFDFFEGGGGEGAEEFSLNSNPNYHWKTYENVAFQISGKSYHK